MTSTLGKKTLRIENRAIKYSLILILCLLIGSFFISGEVLAQINESFETYNLGDINYQGDWFPFLPTFDSWIVNNENASLGIKSIYNHPTSTGGNNISELRFATTTGSGILSFDFYVEEKPVWARIKFYSSNTEIDFEIGNFPSYGTKIQLGSFNNRIDLENGIILADDFAINTWHRISFEYDLPNDWGRASLDFGPWSTTTGICTNSCEPEELIFTTYMFRSSGDDFKRIYIDNFTNVGECNSTCVYCDYSGCQDYDFSCGWNYDEGQCQPLLSGIPDIVLPLEDCEGLGVLEKLVCEIKNFFIQMSAPTPEKITELQTTLDLIKGKFPYNYILETKDFIVYLKDNINEEQEINFSILGQAGTINFDFFDNTAMVAGSSQTFLSIFKKAFGFIIFLIFGIWCFSFLKRVFK